MAGKKWAKDRPRKWTEDRKRNPNPEKNRLGKRAIKDYRNRLKKDLEKLAEKKINKSITEDELIRQINMLMLIYGNSTDTIRHLTVINMLTNFSLEYVDHCQIYKKPGGTNGIEKKETKN